MISFKTIVTLAVIIIVSSLLISIFSRVTGISEEEKRKEWKRFKEANKCELIGIDETGWGGKKYIWKTKDGMTITNYFKK